MSDATRALLEGPVARFVDATGSVMAQARLVLAWSRLGDEERARELTARLLGAAAVPELMAASRAGGTARPGLLARLFQSVGKGARRALEPRAALVVIAEALVAQGRAWHAVVLLDEVAQDAGASDDALLAALELGVSLAAPDLAGPRPALPPGEERVLRAAIEAALARLTALRRLELPGPTLAALQALGEGPRLEAAIAAGVQDEARWDLVARALTHTRGRLSPEQRRQVHDRLVWGSVSDDISSARIAPFVVDDPLVDGAAFVLRVSERGRPGRALHCAAALLDAADRAGTLDARLRPWLLACLDQAFVLEPGPSDVDRTGSGPRHASAQSTSSVAAPTPRPPELPPDEAAFALASLGPPPDALPAGRDVMRMRALAALLPVARRRLPPRDLVVLAERLAGAADEAGVYAGSELLGSAARLLPAIAQDDAARLGQRLWARALALRERGRVATSPASPFDGASPFDDDLRPRAPAARAGESPVWLFVAVGATILDGLDDPPPALVAAIEAVARAQAAEAPAGAFFGRRALLSVARVALRGPGERGDALLLEALARPGLAPGVARPGLAPGVAPTGRDIDPRPAVEPHASTGFEPTRDLPAGRVEPSASTGFEPTRGPRSGPCPIDHDLLELAEVALEVAGDVRDARRWLRLGAIVELLARSTATTRGLADLSRLLPDLVR